MSQISVSIDLNPGTTFASCKQRDAMEEWNECNALQLNSPYSGQLRKPVSTLDENKGIIAEFAAPSFDKCKINLPEKPFPSDECLITLQFNTETYERLPEDYLKVFSATDSGASKQSNGQADNIETNIPVTCEGPIKCSVSFVADNAFFIAGGFAVLGLILIFRKQLRFLVFGNNDQKNKNRRRSRSNNLTSSAATQPPSILLGSSDPSEDRLRALQQRVTNLEQKLETLELRDLEREQAQASIETAKISSTTRSSSSSIQLQPSTLNTVKPPTTPPKALSIDLIKQAVLQNNYSLIQSHPHKFLSETHESRQGLHERKRFNVEGDQNESSAFANSEFIALAVGPSTYLIPNILPNAAEPARTMKRLSDSNDIYRRGSGSNLLNIRELASLQQLAASSYELLSLGQIE